MKMEIVINNADRYAEDQVYRLTSILSDAYYKGYCAAMKECTGIVYGDYDIKYIDLGLPSGTLWGIYEEQAFTYGRANELFQLPTEQDVQELLVNTVLKTNSDGTVYLLGINGNKFYINYPSSG